MDDWLRYRAPLFSSYDIIALLVWHHEGVTGRPNARYQRWKLNAWGYRGPAPRTGTLRVVCLGASETFGIHEDDNREYPRQLEERLNQEFGGATSKSSILALPAMTFHQLVPTLPGIMEQYHPDLVTVYPSTAGYVRLHTSDPPVAGPPPPPPLSNWTSCPAQDRRRNPFRDSSGRAAAQTRGFEIASARRWINRSGSWTGRTFSRARGSTERAHLVAAPAS